MGDANLDGVVDGSDFNLWNSHKFTANPAWSKGDFTADGFVDGSDFNLWNSNKFTSSDGGARFVPALSPRGVAAFRDRGRRSVRSNSHALTADRIEFGLTAPDPLPGDQQVGTFYAMWLRNDPERREIICHYSLRHGQ